MNTRQSAFEAHPGGLAGAIADIEKKIAENEAWLVQYSAEKAAELQSQGVEAVIAFLIELEKFEDCTPADREVLLRFLVNSKS